MHSKALLMGDKEIADKIMQTDDPKVVKALGRLVGNFNQKLWNDNCYKLVLQGNIYKFEQNDESKNILLSTGDRQIFEASPYDRVWGIGISKSDAAKGVAHKGQNLLGKVLMEVRDNHLKTSTKSKN
jgi:ribA/ribD-fused uncharacterized protein